MCVPLDTVYYILIFPAAVETEQVIDYEYSGYNPRGFDIANHFCEVRAQ